MTKIIFSGVEVDTSTGIVTPIKPNNPVQGDNIKDSNKLGEQIDNTEKENILNKQSSSNFIYDWSARLDKAVDDPYAKTEGGTEYQKSMNKTVDEALDGELSTVDMLRIGAAVTDLAGAIGSTIATITAGGAAATGVGAPVGLAALGVSGAIGVGTGLLSTGMNAVAGLIDGDGWTGDDWEQLGWDLGATALSALPAVGSFAKVARIAKAFLKHTNWIPAIVAASGAVMNAPELTKLFIKMKDGNFGDISIEELKALGNLATASASAWNTRRMSKAARNQASKSLNDSRDEAQEVAHRINNAKNNNIAVDKKGVAKQVRQELVDAIHDNGKVLEVQLRSGKIYIDPSDPALKSVKDKSSFAEYLRSKGVKINESMDELSTLPDQINFAARSSWKTLFRQKFNNANGVIPVGTKGMAPFYNTLTGNWSNKKYVHLKPDGSSPGDLRFRKAPDVEAPTNKNTPDVDPEAPKTKPQVDEPEPTNNKPKTEEPEVTEPSNSKPKTEEPEPTNNKPQEDDLADNSSNRQQTDEPEPEIQDVDTNSSRTSRVRDTRNKVKEKVSNLRNSKKTFNRESAIKNVYPELYAKSDNKFKTGKFLGMTTSHEFAQLSFKDKLKRLNQNYKNLQAGVDPKYPVKKYINETSTPEISKRLTPDEWRFRIHMGLNYNSNVRPLFVQQGGKIAGVGVNNNTSWYKDIFLKNKEYILRSLKTDKKRGIANINEGQTNHAILYKKANESGDWRTNAYKDEEVAKYQRWYAGKNNTNIDYNYNLYGIQNALDNNRYNISGKRTSGDWSGKWTEDGLYSTITDDRRLLGRKEDWDTNSAEYKSLVDELKADGIEMYLDTDDYYKLREIATTTQKPVLLPEATPQKNKILENVNNWFNSYEAKQAIVDINEINRAAFLNNANNKKLDIMNDFELMQIRGQHLQRQTTDATNVLQNSQNQVSDAYHQAQRNKSSDGTLNEAASRDASHNIRTHLAQAETTNLQNIMNQRDKNLEIAKFNENSEITTANENSKYRYAAEDLKRTNRMKVEDANTNNINTVWAAKNHRLAQEAERRRSLEESWKTAGIQSTKHIYSDLLARSNEVKELQKQQNDLTAAGITANDPRMVELTNKITQLTNRLKSEAQDEYYRRYAQIHNLPVKSYIDNRIWIPTISNQKGGRLSIQYEGQKLKARQKDNDMFFKNIQKVYKNSREQEKHLSKILLNKLIRIK